MRMPATPVAAAADNNSVEASSTPDSRSTAASLTATAAAAAAVVDSAAAAAAAAAATATATTTSNSASPVASNSASASAPSQTQAQAPTAVLHDAASDGSEPYSSYSAGKRTSIEPRHSTTHRRLAPAPPPPPPSSTNSRHNDTLRFPPSPSPTPSHPTPSHPNLTTISSTSSTYSSSSHTANSNTDRSCRLPAPKPGQCPVMALQNVLCDDDDDDVEAAADAARRTLSHPSQPPTPPILHDASVAMLPVPPPVPATVPSLTLNPILSGPDPSDSMMVTRPNPSHVVMTTRPQIPSRVQQSDPGCKTCQVRKMPCDEGRPTCQNCMRMGIHCLGYFSPPSHAQLQLLQPTDRSVPGPSMTSSAGSTGVNANASRQEQEEYLYFLLDHYRHTKRHCMWDLITLDFNEHFKCKMRKEALQMIKRRRFKDRETRDPSPNDVPNPIPRPKAKRGRRPKFNPATLSSNVRESGPQLGTG
ncbi:C6 finger domain-containing protein [Colletotrichum truncatum]|uniref:C6 finger domain-containing protein n=1 Tax=Colletotrichum truncatum TaxID=5467 RepID=A0ACC3YD29_COLTU